MQLVIEETFFFYHLGSSIVINQGLVAGTFWPSFQTICSSAVIQKIFVILLGCQGGIKVSVIDLDKFDEFSQLHHSVSDGHGMLNNIFCPSFEITISWRISPKINLSGRLGTTL